MPETETHQALWRPLAPLVIGVGVLVLIARGCMPLWPAPVTQSKSTSFLLGPVHPDGTVDYAAAVNDILGEGVTDANNAVVPMLRALGPKLLSDGDRDGVLAALGLAELAEDDDHFVEFGEYLAARMTDEELAVPPQTDGSRRAARITDRYMKRMLAGKSVDGGSDSEFGRALDATVPTKSYLARKRAYKTFEQAGTSPWKAGEHPLLAEWIEANAARLALIAGASRRKRWFIPITTDQLGKRGLVSIRTMSAVGEALACGATLSLGSGDAKGAFEQAQTIHRLARLLPQARYVMAHMIGLKLEMIACRVDAAIARTATKRRLPAPQTREFLARLRSIPPWPNCKDAMDFGERCHALDNIASAVHRVRGPRKKEIDLDLMLGRINEFFDSQVACYDEPTFAARKAAFQALNASEMKTLTDCTKRYTGTKGKLRMVLASSWGRRRIKSRLIANVVLAIVIPNLESTESANAEGAMRRGLAEVALALAVHRAEKGSLPATLAALIPDCLPDLPTDVFTGKPFRYRRDGEGYVLYSVGKDMKDDDGDAKKDLVVRVE